MKVSNVMSRGVRTIAPGETADRAWELMNAEGIHHLVVVHDGKLVGVVSDRDLGGRHGDIARRGRTVEEVMTASLVTATPETTLRRAANMMRGRSIGCLPILDRKGALAGILTVSDVLTLVGQGAERPVERTKRWTLTRRGPRRKPVAAI